jgi:heavy metal efflux system protein
LQTAVAGRKSGVIYEGNRRFDVVVRMESPEMQKIEDIGDLMVSNSQGTQIPLKQLAEIKIENGPAVVNRQNNERCLNVNLNIRGRDVQSVVSDVQAVIIEKIKLPQGYRITYGGQFENLINAKKRLMIVVPAALGLIFLLLYLTFGNIKESLLVFTAIPFAATGGILALWLRDMPFSISAGVGFIALFGVAVLNGLVLIGYFKQLQEEGETDVKKRIITGVMTRFRPVIMTATVASLGFLPMALASGAGAEVQKPLATVVIGGLLSATLLTLVLLPALYSLMNKKSR